MNKKPRHERKKRILKKRIILFFLACVCFTAGAICVMILVHFKRPVLISPLTSAKTKQIQNEQTQQINDVKKVCNSEEVSCGNITITGDRMIHMTLPAG